MFKKHVWYELEPHGALEDHKDKVIQDSNSDAAVAQRDLEVKQLKENTNMDCLRKEEAHLGIKVWTDIEVSARHDAEYKSGVTKKMDGALIKVFPMSRSRGFTHGYGNSNEGWAEQESSQCHDFMFSIIRTLCSLLYEREALTLEDVMAKINSMEIKERSKAKGDDGERLYVRGRTDRMDSRQSRGKPRSKSRGGRLKCYIFYYEDHLKRNCLKNNRKKSTGYIKKDDQPSSSGSTYDNSEVMMVMSTQALLD
nr:zinc finger, CCHC-type [Tanacetum cinerariifolium]